MKSFLIGQQKVGDGHPCFIIAEAGVNHNGSTDLAHRLIDVAADAGADAVKFQTFKAEELAAPSAPQAQYQVRNTGIKESQTEMLKRLELPKESYLQLRKHAEERGILFLSTPFDHASVDFLVELGVSALKTPSGEITNLPYLKHVAAKGLPIIMSTGMSNLGEVEAAVEVVEKTSKAGLALLHCVSNYPADLEDVNLKAMHTLRQAFGYPAGYSDHTDGIEISLAAVALGATVIEKHYTLDRAMPGPDHIASLIPLELEQMVKGIRNIEKALVGSGRKQITARERDTAKVARKSLVARTNIAAGSKIDAGSVAIMRPGDGLPPSLLEFVVNRTAKVAIPKGSLIALDMLQ